MVEFLKGLFKSRDCEACRALRDEIQDLRAERNYFRQQVMNLLIPTGQLPQEKSSQPEHLKPVEIPSLGWLSTRRKLEQKSKLPKGQLRPQEQARAEQEAKVLEYWKKKNAEMEAAAGLPIQSDMDAMVQKKEDESAAS